MSAISCDEDLLRRLPLPLAQLYRRAHNAKNPLDRLLAAYYLWEANLKLLASVAIVAYAERGAHDPKLAERLQNLARPALGHWWEFVRTLLPILAADEATLGFRAPDELLFGRARTDFPRAAGLDAVLRQEMDASPGARSTVRLSELFERIIRYRNAVVGHGAAGQQPASTYERVGQAMLAGTAEILSKLDPLIGGRLIFVSEVRRLADGQWLVERTELIGESARRIESLDWPADRIDHLPQPERVYLQRSETEFWSLHPLLLFDPETSEVLWLNARRDQKRTEYLCYGSGKVLERKELLTDQRALLARVLGISPDSPVAAAWTDNIQAEEAAAAHRGALRSIGEFELLSELGRGGMGVVYRAYQPSLGRQVALKCLLRSGDSKAEARFNREIHALGRVEHPHLVKIFTSGSEGDQWFYAMELIEGATLSAVGEALGKRGSSASDINVETWQDSLSSACDEARKAERPLGAADTEPDGAAQRPAAEKTQPPASGRSYVRQVIELVRQVAEAAHALHEAGVIHRDIKPGNIMVTADGREAILMDLGLAQLADEAQGRLTRTQQFVGTLRYASPEQIMAVGQLSRRSDVYSLGATLWEMLTLHPLFGATDDTPPPQLIHAIQFDDPERPRKYHAGIASDLEAIVLKCLEKNPSKRYASAQGLADDLDRWLKGELVTAQPLTFGYAASKFVRKHRLAIAAAGLLVVVAIGGAAFSFYQIQKALAVARTERNRAEANLAQARKAVDDSFVQISENTLLNAPGMEPLRQELLSSAIEYYREFTKQHAGDRSLQAELAQAYARLGVIRSASSTKGSEREAIDHYEKALGILRELLKQHPGDPAIEHDLAHSLTDLGNIYADLGSTKQAESAYKESLALRQRLVAQSANDPEYRRDLATTQSNLGYLYGTINRIPEAKQAYLAALQIGRRLVQENPQSLKDLDSLGTALNNFGVFHRYLGQYRPALEATREAVTLREKLAREHPEVVVYRAHLAASYEGLANILDPLGDLKAAERAHQDSIKLWEALVREHPTVADYQNALGESYGNLGSLHRVNGQIDSAESAYKKAQQVFHDLASARPGMTRYQLNLAELHYSLGNLFKSQEQVEKAQAEYDQAIAIWNRLITKEPGIPEYQSGLASTYDSMGQLQAMSNREAEAEISYQKAGQILEQLAQSNPQSTIYPRDRALTLIHRGELARDTGKADQALASYQEALGIYERLAKDHPDVTDYQDYLASAYDRVGLWYTYNDQPERGREWLQRALDLREAMAHVHPELVTNALSLGTVLYSMGSIALGQKQPETALRYFERSIAAESVPLPEGPHKNFQRGKLLKAHWGRARAFEQLGKLAEAISEWSQAMQLADEPTRLEIGIEQASAQVRQGHHDQAAQEARELAQGKSLSGANLYNLACVLSLAAEAAANDESLPADKRQSIASQHAEQAMKLLDLARAAGLFADPANTKLLQEDTDLAALRSRDDFKTLLGKVSKPPAASHRTP